MSDVELMIKERIGYIPKDLVLSEKGHAARGTIECIYCKGQVKITACSDVSGVWTFCPKCGMDDI